MEKCKLLYAGFYLIGFSVNFNINVAFPRQGNEFPIINIYLISFFFKCLVDTCSSILILQRLSKSNFLISERSDMEQNNWVLQLSYKNQNCGYIYTLKHVNDFNFLLLLTQFQFHSHFGCRLWSEKEPDCFINREYLAFQIALLNCLVIFAQQIIYIYNSYVKPPNE